MQAEFHECLGGQERNMALIANQLERVLESVATLSAQVAQAPPTPPLPHFVPNDPPAAVANREPKLQLPCHYEGQPGKCLNFLAQCEIF